MEKIAKNFATAAAVRRAITRRVFALAFRVLRAATAVLNVGEIVADRIALR